MKASPLQSLGTTSTATAELLRPSTQASGRFEASLSTAKALLQHDALPAHLAQSLAQHPAAGNVEQALLMEAHTIPAANARILAGAKDGSPPSDSRVDIGEVALPNGKRALGSAGETARVPSDELASSGPSPDVPAHLPPHTAQRDTSATWHPATTVGATERETTDSAAPSSSRFSGDLPQWRSTVVAGAQRTRANAAVVPDQGEPTAPAASSPPPAVARAPHPSGDTRAHLRSGLAAVAEHAAGESSGESAPPTIHSASSTVARARSTPGVAPAQDGPVRSDTASSSPATTAAAPPPFGEAPTPDGPSKAALPPVPTSDEAPTPTRRQATASSARRGAAPFGSPSSLAAQSRASRSAPQPASSIATSPDTPAATVSAPKTPLAGPNPEVARDDASPQTSPSPAPEERALRTRAADPDAAVLAQNAGTGPFVRSTQLFDTSSKQLKGAPANQTVVSAQHVIDSVATRSKSVLETLRVSTPAESSSLRAGRAPRIEEPERDGKVKAHADEPAPPSPVQLSPPSRGPVLGAPLSAPADATPRVPAPLEPFISQLVDDPTARISLTSSVARLSLDTGDAGRLSVQLKVSDGVADVKASGPAAPMLDARQNELRVALAHEGLSLGHFDMGQNQHRPERPDAPEPERPSQPARTARPTTPDPVANDGRIHVKA